MPATAADYHWFADRFAALAEAYCLTLVRDLDPAEVVRRLEGTGERTLTGLAEVLRPAAGDEEFVAVAALDGWALLVEPFGYLGVTDDVNGPLSAGTRLVAHYRNLTGGDQFVVVEDGEVVEDFAPSERFGADPIGGALARAEELTGVRLTAALLAGATYLCADVPEPL